MPKQVRKEATFPPDAVQKVTVEVHPTVLLKIANKCRAAGWQKFNGNLTPDQIIAAALDNALFNADGADLVPYIPNPRPKGRRKKAVDATDDPGDLE